MEKPTTIVIEMSIRSLKLRFGSKTGAEEHRFVPGYGADLSKLVIHWLSAGRTLCCMDSVPRDWPRDHYWVNGSYKEDETRVTCEVCKVKLKSRRT